MTSWESTPATRYATCRVCGCVTRHDAGRCMYDPSSVIARLVRRDLPEQAERVARHDPQARLDV